MLLMLDLPLGFRLPHAAIVGIGQCIPHSSSRRAGLDPAVTFGWDHYLKPNEGSPNPIACPIHAAALMMPLMRRAVITTTQRLVLSHGSDHLQ